MVHRQSAFLSVKTTSRKVEMPTCRGGDVTQPMLPTTLLGGEFMGIANDVMTASTLGFAADGVAQWFERRKKLASFPEERQENLNDGIDLRRSAAYAVFNGVYSGGFQHIWFSKLNGIVPNPVDRLFLNQICIIPLCYYPLLIWLVPKLRARSKAERTQLRSSINVKKMIPINWAFWVPLQYLMFSYIPVRYQVAYCAVVGCIWKFLLSFLTAGSQPEKAQVSNPTAEAANEVLNRVRENVRPGARRRYSNSYAG